MSFWRYKKGRTRNMGGSLSQLFLFVVSQGKGALLPALQGHAFQNHSKNNTFLNQNFFIILFCSIRENKQQLIIKKVFLHRIFNHCKSQNISLKKNKCIWNKRCFLVTFLSIIQLWHELYDYFKKLLQALYFCYSQFIKEISDYCRRGLSVFSHTP